MSSEPTREAGSRLVFWTVVVYLHNFLFRHAHLGEDATDSGDCTLQGCHDDTIAKKTPMRNSLPLAPVLLPVPYSRCGSSGHFPTTVPRPLPI